MATLTNTKWSKYPEKMTETLANGYSSEGSQRELSKEYQHDRMMVFENICVFVFWTKVASALEGLKAFAPNLDI